MKFLIYIAVFALMIWALIEQTNETPNIWIQIAAVIVFFGLMMWLMNKTASNTKNNKDDNSKEVDE